MEVCKLQSRGNLVPACSPTPVLLCMFLLCWRTMHLASLRPESPASSWLLCCRGKEQKAAALDSKTTNMSMAGVLKQVETRSYTLNFDEDF